MKNIKRICLTMTAIAMVPMFAQAEVSVKDTTSYEFIKNQGYSDEVHRIIEVKTKDPATPIAAEKKSKFKKFGWYLLDNVDSSYNKPDKFVDHNIDYSKSLDDL